VSPKTPVGVYWGRFNPPHRGHLEVIRRFAPACRLIVAVGSSEQRDTWRNPFSGRERKSMLEAYLREEGIQGVRVITCRDGPTLRTDLDRLIRRSRASFLLLSSEKGRLARLARQRIRVVSFRRTGSVSSTRMRELIAAGDPKWRKLTGRSVAALIRRMGGIERIRAAHRGATAEAHAEPA
jgi:nicotinamide-nucleotide adenylyltransferase